MSLRIAVKLIEQLREMFPYRAGSFGIRISSLTLWQVEESYPKYAKRKTVTGPIIRGSGKLGERFPKELNPHEIIFLDPMPDCTGPDC